MIEGPDTRLTWSSGFSIPFQVTGTGGTEILYLPGWASNVIANRWVAEHARFLDRLSSFARLIVMDRRGVGCADRLPPGTAATLEELVDDVLAVMAAAYASRKTVLFGVQETGFIAMLAAATHPERFGGLVLFGCTPSFRRSEELPWQWDEDLWEGSIRQFESATSLRDMADSYVRESLPSLYERPDVRHQMAALMALTNGAGAAIADIRKFSEVDLLELLPAIRLPTLVLHRTLDPVEPVQSGRLLAERIPDARFVELPGEDALPWAGEASAVLDEVQKFLTGDMPSAYSPERRIATVLFTDIVGSTERAASLGDARWRELLEQHHHEVRGALARSHGVEIDTAGDGFFATFDGPARAVECARAIVASVEALGLQVRVGVHTGEVEQVDGKLAGIAVVIGARTMSLARASDVLVTSTVRDLAAGSGLAFEDAGEHELKGVPDSWHLYRVVN